MILLCGTVIAKADTIITIDGYSYTLNQYGMAVLVGWDNSSETLHVPHYIGNVLVAEIGDSAFSGDDFIKTLDLSDANRMYHIGEFAFSDSVLEGELVIPSRVTYVGVAAFQNCDSLTDVLYSSDGGSVSPQCFMDCDDLESVTLTDNITGIERYAFKNCHNLTAVNISKNVTSINSTAFAGCENVVFYCYTDSCAHEYAEANGIEYVLLDAPVEYTFILGDADGDGDVNIMDATRIQRVLAGLVDDEDGLIALRAANGEALSIMHATRVQRWLVDYEVPVSIGESVTVTI